MSNSTTLLDTLTSNQSSKEVTANALFDAGSPATLWGRRASTCSGLTWGYYGGYFNGSIANGTVLLTASTTNYLQAHESTGAVSVNTTGFTTGKIPLYEIVTGTATVTSYTDRRSYSPQALSGTGVSSVNGLTGAVTLTTDNVSQGSTNKYFSNTLARSAVSASGSLSYNSTTGVFSYTESVSSVAGKTGAVTLATGDISGLGTVATLASDTDGTLAANSDSRVATQKATKTYVDAAVGVKPFDVHAFYPGVPTASAKVLRIPVSRAVTFAANFSGSYAKASANATGSTVFDIQKNGSSIGSATFAAGAATATFTSSGGTSQSLAAGDVLSIVAPGTADATLADIGFALAGTR
jgi:hypothetical protein